MLTGDVADGHVDITRHPHLRRDLQKGPAAADEALVDAGDFRPRQMFIRWIETASRTQRGAERGLLAGGCRQERAMDIDPGHAGGWWRQTRQGGPRGHFTKMMQLVQVDRAFGIHRPGFLDQQL